MKYRSINMLRDFVFHDALWEFVSCDSGELVVDVRFLNVRHGTEQNPADCDMEIQLARITFIDFRVISYRAEDAVPPDKSETVYTGDEAFERFLNELKYDITIYSFAQESGGVWKACCCGDAPFFEAQLSFSGVTVEWDEYKGVAWYVKK